jgi:hypothetical protein
MSLFIDVDTVVAVLLPDGWHEVLNDSFVIDSYEFAQGEMTLHSEGAGYSFVTSNPNGSVEKVTISGPVTAIQAVLERA